MTKKAQEDLEYTLATHAIEKLVPSKEARHLCEQISEGAVSANDAVEAILRQYGVKRVQAYG